MGEIEIKNLYNQHFKERMQVYMAEPDDLTPKEIEGLKDGYPVSTDWTTPANKKLFSGLAQNKLESKRRHKVQRCADRARADANQKVAEYKAMLQDRITEERGTYRERLDDFQHGEEASKAQLKAEILAIKNPQKRFQAIKQNADLFKK